MGICCVSSNSSSEVISGCEIYKNEKIVLFWPKMMNFLFIWICFHLFNALNPYQIDCAGSIFNVALNVEICYFQLFVCMILFSLS
jgi:hypothetical protein